MWKKFCVAIISFVLLSGITVATQQLLASSNSQLEVQQVEHRNYYINEDVAFFVQSANVMEEVLYVSGGNVIGNSEEYSIPFQENSEKFTLNKFTKPGVYQGNVDVQVNNTQQTEVHSERVPFSFTIYGKAFQHSTYSLNVLEETTLLTYGTLPETLKGHRIQYTSSDEHIVSIDSDAHVKALQKGSADIQVEVFDALGNSVSISSCTIHVAKQETIEINYDTAIPGVEHEYRFVQMDTLYEGNNKDKSIGSIHLGQSGLHTFYVAEENKADIRIEDGTIFLNMEVKANTYHAMVYARHVESNKVYSIEVTYQIQEKKVEEESSFAFRYQGEVVTHIIHAYQEGANSFQVSSNQAVGNVYFKLKDEVDSEYISVSQSGNVSIKKVTKEPVILTATWQKKDYEIPVVIEKAEQVISMDMKVIYANIEDGAFEPIIKGNQGSGSLLLTSSNSDVASIVSANNTMSIQPHAQGKTTIEVYNNGDENYKKSNVLQFELYIEKDENKEGNVLQAQSNWLLYPQPNGLQNWYTEEVSIKVNPNIKQISQFLYQGEWMEEVIVSENGVQNIPFIFKDETLDVESNAWMLQLAIDTHAPIMTQMSEQSVTDNEWKELLNKATFQKTYGTGMKITLEASDALMDPNIKVSGVSSIKYKVYAIENDEEELIVESEAQVVDNHISFVVDDTRLHKVCALAVDNAGLSSFETCSILDENTISLTSENTGILIKGRGLQANANFQIENVVDTIMSNAPLLEDNEEVKAAINITLEQDIVQHEDYSIIIPLRKMDSTLANGTWKQQREDGSYEDVVSVYDETACTITTPSLSTLIYVADKDDERSFQSLQLPVKNNIKASQDRTVVENTFATSQFTIKEIDTNLLIGICGGLLAILFGIIVFRANSEHPYE